jgi:hypothetical protein
MQLTVSGLVKLAIFTTNVDAENQTLINHKCVCGALNRHFCQTRVMPSLFFLGRAVPIHSCIVLVRLLGSSFAFFCLACVLAKNANVLPIGLAVCYRCAICAINVQFIFVI